MSGPEACPMSAITHEIAAYTRHHGEEPTVTDMARWMGLTLDIAAARIGRCVEHGHVVRVWPARERHGVRGGKRQALALTESGRASAATSSGMGDIPREHGVTVPISHRGNGASPDHAVGRRRLAIAREVVREMGLTRDEDRTLETCPVIVEVHRRWEAESLGGAPWTLEEVGIVCGVGRERVRQIEERACKTLRTALRPYAVRETIRELDAHRAEHWSAESAA